MPIKNVYWPANGVPIGTIFRTPRVFPITYVASVPIDDDLKFEITYIYLVKSNNKWVRSLIFISDELIKLSAYKYNINW